MKNITYIFTDASGRKIKQDVSEANAIARLAYLRAREADIIANHPTFSGRSRYEDLREQVAIREAIGEVAESKYIVRPGYGGQWEAIKKEKKIEIGEFSEVAEEMHAGAMHTEDLEWSGCRVLK